MAQERAIGPQGVERWEHDPGRGGRPAGYYSTRVPGPGLGPTDRRSSLIEPAAPVPGRTLVTRRTVSVLARRAAASCYGVVGVAGPDRWHDLLAWLGFGSPGVRVRLRPDLRVVLYLSVARGVPVAEVAHNAEDAVRYALRRALGREPAEVAIHIAGMRVAPGARGGPPDAPSAEPG
ncbi:MAG: Asp23/Gls24 family envelope stress response protein [Candidatus Limnocylindrales bacterium]